MNEPSIELLQRAILKKREEKARLKAILKKPTQSQRRAMGLMKLTELSYGRRFKQIPGHPSYEISEDGVLKYMSRAGYQTCKKANDSKTYQKHRIDGKYMLVHHLVMSAWGEPKPDGQGQFFLRHLDDNKNNNHISNLAWGTPKENSEDQIRNNSDRWALGGYHHKQKLLLKEALEIMALIDSGKSDSDIAKLYYIDRTSVRCIRNGKSWSFARREIYPEWSKATS